MNTVSLEIAKQLRAVYFGGNWTWSNFKEHLQDVTWQQAIKKIYSLNTIVALVYHSGYYVTSVTKVLEGGPLDSKDKYSFDHPVIDSDVSWKSLLEKTYHDVERLAILIEQLPEEKLFETFVQEKYGNYHRNLHGVIEHSHYHLGQIVLIKKIILAENPV